MPACLPDTTPSTQRRLTYGHDHESPKHRTRVVQLQLPESESEWEEEELSENEDFLDEYVCVLSHSGEWVGAGTGIVNRETLSVRIRLLSRLLVHTTKRDARSLIFPVDALLLGDWQDIDVGDENVLSQFMSAEPSKRLTLADMVMDRIKEKQTEIQSMMSGMYACPACVRMRNACVCMCKSISPYRCCSQLGTRVETGTPALTGDSHWASRFCREDGGDDAQHRPEGGGRVQERRQAAGDVQVGEAAEGVQGAGALSLAVSLRCSLRLRKDSAAAYSGSLCRAAQWCLGVFLFSITLGLVRTLTVLLNLAPRYTDHPVAAQLGGDPVHHRAGQLERGCRVPGVETLHLQPERQGIPEVKPDTCSFRTAEWLSALVSRPIVVICGGRFVLSFWYCRLHVPGYREQ